MRPGLESSKSVVSSVITGAGLLAFCPRPLAGESFLSWIDVVAECYGIGRQQAFHTVGLSWANHRLSRLSLAMPAQFADQVVVRTGLSPSELKDLTIARYPGLDDAVRGGDPLWVQANTSAACVDCLGENGGRWMLEWKMAFVVACQMHGRFLVGRCGCGRGLHRSSIHSASRWRCTGLPRAIITSPEPGGRCTRRVTDLSAPAPRDVELLNTQAAIMALVTATSPTESATSTFADLQWAARLVAETGTGAVLDDCADPLVCEVFEQFCRYRAEFRSKDTARWSRQRSQLLHGYATTGYS
ncbi:TniQ family protein [Nocardia sp. NPDC050175]|uniref:TniQ family protein n=1 Tax=Nocardia sp. NPDC050175 TaxID=3364317 RepID=UPI0037B48490